MKWFRETKIQNVNDLRSAYKKLLIKYHPDNNEEDTTLQMQEINAEYDSLFQRLKDGFEHSESYEHQTDRQKQTYDWQKDTQIRDIILKLSYFTKIEVEICGVWIWVSNCYEYRKELKELGFHWAKQKQMWYLHFDDYHKFGQKTADMDYIRSKYGSVKIKTEKEESQKRRIRQG